MLIVYYPSKKALRECVGQPLNYKETSMFGDEFKRNGTFAASNRPALSGVKGREFFASITMQDGLIAIVD